MDKQSSSVLVAIEHDGRQAKPASLRAIRPAMQLGTSYSLVCLGHQIQSVAESVRNIGATNVFIVDDERLANPLADRDSQVLSDVVKRHGFTTVLAATSTYSRDVLPRLAALMDAPMATDVQQIDAQANPPTFYRLVNAGSEVTSITLAAPRMVLSIRPGAFELPGRIATESPLVPFEIISELPSGMRFISRELRMSQRPELTEARVVVAGGRPIKDSVVFEETVGRLADVLGAAVGSTRALVDAGVTPNDWQIGQTGKVLSPDLYIALGVSGAVQHLAGITDARVIVAINKDPTAPMMKVATYSLTGDLFELVPQLINALQQAK
jgi:electron transfer flavoprotein alpha subunit